MAEDFVTRTEYLEHQKVADAEREAILAANQRQNERLEKIEHDVESIHELALSVNTLATNMQHMLEELKTQGERLDRLEKKDGDMWRNFAKAIVTGVAMLIVGYVFGKMTGQ